jgi:hypothetical protein
VGIRHRDAPAIGIEEDLAGIVAHAVLGLERPVDAIAIDLARPQAADEHVPVMVGRLAAGSIRITRAACRSSTRSKSSSSTPVAYLEPRSRTWRRR